MKSITQIIGIVFIIVVLTVVVAFVISLPIMWLWNWLMPVIFGLPEITWTQALGLSILSSLLFKSGNISRNKD